MIYNNLIYFLVAIFLFSSKEIPRTPWISPKYGLPLLLLMFLSFWYLSGYQFFRLRNGSSRAYFKVEKKVSVFALLYFIAALYLIDIKYYLAPLSLGGTLPSLVNIGGLVLFFLFLSLMWIRARKFYQDLFGRHYSSWGFVLNNIRINLPIVLPWIALSLVFDFLLFLPLPEMNRLIASGWGDLILFLVFIILLGIFFPPLIRKLWNCKPIPEGPLLNRLKKFCHSQNFYSDILLWPLFEGQVITAGIMGIVPKFRYLLITPALLATMSSSEIDAVLAHEIGHVKKMHLVLYVFLIVGFSLLLGTLAKPLPYLIISSYPFYFLLEHLDITPDSLVAVLSVIPMLALLLIYFRFIFGFFIRNFERQADLYVFKTQGTSKSLISAFEKIARLSGNIRSEKSWHHFGIKERIDFLESSELDRSIIRRHDRKIFFNIVGFIICLLSIAWFVNSIHLEPLPDSVNFRYMEAVLKQKARLEPDKGIWLRLIGDLMQEKSMEKKALEAYEKALDLEPLNAEIKNNLAWLLLTAKDNSLRDPIRALTLARSASVLKENGYILDTLGMAFWANGFREEAVEAEIQAIQKDPDNSRYYKNQINKFTQQSWGQEDIK